MGANSACHLSTRLLHIFIVVVLILATSCCTCTSAYGDQGGVTDPTGGTRGPSCCHIPGCC
ncbi:hypothetical protein BS78_09G051300 [Paspalum vaginatum]|nr:hypothetical protein BS78_09G051300 [Paspalum vaginatum]